MYLLLQLLVIVLVFISLEHEAITTYAQPYSSVVAQVNKHTDAAKPVYSVQIMTSRVEGKYLHANFIIDIDAPFIWHDCKLSWNTYSGTSNCPSDTLCAYPVDCDEYQCEDVRTTFSYKNPSCPMSGNSWLPGWGCTCQVHGVNPVSGSCNNALLNYDDFTLYVSNGRNVGIDAFNQVYGANPNAACASSSSSFPANVSGVMAFSTSPYALPAYLNQPLKKTLALCFPSKLTAPGVLFYGTGPYYLLPQPNIDVRSYLSYTPLLTRQDSFGYFISVNGIVIKKRLINVSMNTTTTKLSTIDPYTTLRTDIYNAVIRRFSLVTKRIPPAKPVAPFGLCYTTSTVGLKVPDIDIILPVGNKWSVSTANSIKQVTNEVACLAFVDGGATSEPAIVIGTFQFEDNFLEFNLQNSTLGFSSSLLRKKTSCANFNFTLTG